MCTIPTNPLRLTIKYSRYSWAITGGSAAFFFLFFSHEHPHAEMKSVPFLKGCFNGLIIKPLRKLGLQGVKKKNRCYYSLVIFLARKSHLSLAFYQSWSLFFFSLQAQFLGFFMQP
jgi:hypothetical protein